MTESKIFEILSNVSDEAFHDSLISFPDFDTEISAWKKSSNLCPFKLVQIPEPVKIRIRTVKSWTCITPNSSSISYIGTLSSSAESRTESPCINPDSQKAEHTCHLPKDNSKSGRFDRLLAVPKPNKLTKVLQGSVE